MHLHIPPKPRPEMRPSSDSRGEPIHFMFLPKQKPLEPLKDKSAFRKINQRNRLSARRLDADLIGGSCVKACWDYEYFLWVALCQNIHPPFIDLSP